MKGIEIVSLKQKGEIVRRVPFARPLGHCKSENLPARAERMKKQIFYRLKEIPVYNAPTPLAPYMRYVPASRIAEPKTVLREYQR